VAIINIDPAFQKEIPKLRKEELAQLEASLQREGCKDPLRLWGNILIDGHNRHEICKRLGIPFGITRIDLDSREDALQWIRRNQLGRRNITDAYRKILIQKIAGEQAKLSRKNASHPGKSVAPENGGGTSKKRTQDRVAKENGVSKHALEQAKIINDAAEKSSEGAAVLAKVRDGEITNLSAAVKMVKPEVNQPKPRRSKTPSQYKRGYNLGFFAGLSIGIHELIGAGLTRGLTHADAKVFSRRCIDRMLPDEGRTPGRAKVLEALEDEWERLEQEYVELSRQRTAEEQAKDLDHSAEAPRQWTTPQIIEIEEGLAIQ
jgi:hypothetical protein